LLGQNPDVFGNSYPVIGSLPLDGTADLERAITAVCFDCGLVLIGRQVHSYCAQTWLIRDVQSHRMNVLTRNVFEQSHFSNQRDCLAIGVDVGLDLEQRWVSTSGRDVIDDHLGDRNTTTAVFDDSHRDDGLLVGRRQVATLPSRDRCPSGNDHNGRSGVGLHSDVMRAGVEQKYVLDRSLENTCLDGGAKRHDRVRCQIPAGTLVELAFGALADHRCSCRQPDQQHVIDRVDRPLPVHKRCPARVDRCVREVEGEVFELMTRDRYGKVVGAAGGDALTDRVAETLRQWADFGGQRGMAAVLEAARKAGIGRRVLSWEGGERDMTDLAHIGQLLHETAHTEGYGLPALRDWLRQQCAEKSDDIERSRRLDSDAQAVQIMTVWGAKGLQFPIVYLPFAFNRHVKTGEDLLLVTGQVLSVPCY
jgi:hypothetical protein